MNGEVIKSFLVGLGFGVDESSLAKFNKAITSASLRVTALYAAVKVAAVGIFWSISKISEGFEQMGYEYRIIAPAINKALVLRRELLKAYSAAGINITKVVQQSIKFNMSLAKTEFALKAIYTSVGAKFFPMLTKQMDVFRSKIYANMPKIQAMLEKFITFIFKAFDATVILGTRVWSILSRIYDFFYKLHRATDGWSTVVIGLIAAWKLLNLSFLATPLGMILTGLLAIVALYDDFMVWKEGGKSFFDWGSDTAKVMVGLAVTIGAVAASIYAASVAIKVVQATMVAFEAIVGILGAGLKVLRLTWLGLNMVMFLNPIGIWILGITALIALIAVLIVKWDVIKSSIGSFFSGLGSQVMDFVGGAEMNVAQNMEAGVGGRPGAPKGLGTNVSNQQQTNMNVTQQTTIAVNGAADANAVGKNVAGQQDRVNFDMTRNMKGAVR